MATTLAPQFKVRGALVKGAVCEVVLCQCNRCGNIWKPRQPKDGVPKQPSKCPACFSPLWNKPRVYEIEGAEAPTQAPKPRGKAFGEGYDERRPRQKSKKEAEELSARADN